ncbi:hypothetical protein KV102_14595 [Mumia sp. zg.B53]|uniref:hypothetical protein n=1 Tax=Mumia sp. zg.B53 TaxID=2855449 RepID=UPI001C6F25A7|nr:hypothetical protein [Mumia sp. zg.B53]MBW9216065.1 hypothetical protein [Mumia sp. zg.B53]
MSMSRAVAAASVVLVLLATAACSDDDDDPDDQAQPTATATDTTEPSPGATATATLESEDEAGEFELDTTDDSVDVDGRASECQSPDDATLKVTFTDEGTTVTADISGGTGTVTVTGGIEFEGDVASVQVSDNGTLNAFGQGSLSRPGAEKTAFTLVGRC